jgi:transcriptional regulator with GAF, ATPase, and Fis domain
LSLPAIDGGVQFIYINAQMSKRSQDSVGLFRPRISRKLLDYKFTGNVNFLCKNLREKAVLLKINLREKKNLCIFRQVRGIKHAEIYI